MSEQPSESSRIRPLLAITLGDPAGIGPEIILKALWHKEIFDRCRPLVIGDSRILERASIWLGSDPITIEQVLNPWDGEYQHGTVPVFNLHHAAARRMSRGAGKRAGGKGSR